MTLPSGWTTASLLEIVDLHDTYRIPLNKFERAAKPGLYPYFGANGQVDTVGDYIFDGQYILLAEDGGYFDQPGRGVSYEASGRFWVNNHAHILSSHGGIPHGFLSRLFNHIDWTPYVSGTTRLKLTQGGMSRLNVPLPPLAEQHRILAKLEALTTHITRGRGELKRVRTLADQLREKTLSWARESVRNTPELKISEILSVSFDGPFGSKLKSSDYVEDGVRVVRLENIGHLFFVEDKRTYISVEKYPSLEKHTLQGGDVLFSSFVDERVRVCIYSANATSKAINKADCFVLRTDNAKVCGKFLSYMLASQDTFTDLQRIVHGDTRPRVSLGQLRNYKLNIPCLEKQQHVVAQVETSFAHADHLEAEAARADKLLDRLESSIVSKAFRGDLVPQDPFEEPASALLGRIRVERAEAPKARRSRGAAGHAEAR